MLTLLVVFYRLCSFIFEYLIRLCSFIFECLIRLGKNAGRFWKICSFIFEYLIRLGKNADFRKICSLIMAFLIAVSLSGYYFNILAEPIAHAQAEKNRHQLEQIVEELIKDVDTDENKTIAVLKWFDYNAGNIHNAYHLEHRGKAIIYPLFWPFQIRTRVSLITKEPYIGIRVYKDEDSLWILTTRYGHCGEFALLFRDMANAAGLKVRRIVCPGENHEWNEVLIDNRWIVIDATRVGTAKDNGFDIPPSFMENKIANEKHILQGNVSYVYAEYANGTIVDVTSTYTNITNITIRVIDEKSRPLAGVKLRVISHNRDYRRDTKMPHLITDKSGVCTFSIGGGKYTIKATKDGFIPLHGKIKITAIENQPYNNATIYLKRDFTNIMYMVFVVSSIAILLIVLYYYFHKKNRCY